MTRRTLFGHTPHLDALDNQELVQAITMLSPPEQHVLVHRFFAGLSVAETARTLSMPAGTVKSHQARAVTKLQSILEHRQREREGIRSDRPGPRDTCELRLELARLATKSPTVAGITSQLTAIGVLRFPPGRRSIADKVIRSLKQVPSRQM